MNKNFFEFEKILEELIRSLTQDFPNLEFSFEKEETDFWGFKYCLIRNGTKTDITLPVDFVMEAYFCPMMLIEYKAALKYEVNRYNNHFPI